MTSKTKKNYLMVSSSYNNLDKIYQLSLSLAFIKTLLVKRKTKQKQNLSIIIIISYSLIIE